MTDSAAQFATPRVTAGALFVQPGEVFLVRKTYGYRWDIPGGYVDRAESPAAACQRELCEELGIDRAPSRMLVHDWAPSDPDGDKLLYVFDCGSLGVDQDNIALQESELDRWDWVPVDRLGDYVVPRLARRLWHAYQAHESGDTAYLEHGEPALALRQTTG